MNPVGVAVVGAGPWGTTLARAFAQVRGAELRWICDLDEQRRAQAGAAHPRAQVTAALDRVLDDPRVHAAVVAVDSPRHYSVGLRVLEANRDLLVEKPMALSVADAAGLQAAARVRGRLLTVGHLLLHHPAVQRARQLLSSGALGRPLYLEATRTAAGPGRREASAWWTLAPHDISLALYLFDAVPLAITAAARIAPEGHDIATFATMHFPDGRLAHVHAARLAPQKERRFSLVGERRSLVFDELAPQEHLRYCEPSTEGEGAIVERIPVETAEPLLAQCASFVEGVARGDAAAGNAAHALSVVRVLAAGARSMSEGGVPVEVS